MPELIEKPIKNVFNAKFYIYLSIGGLKSDRLLAFSFPRVFLAVSPIPGSFIRTTFIGTKSSERIFSVIPRASRRGLSKY
jgi:hypothetical protein